MNLTSISEDVGLIPGLSLIVAASCSVGSRHSLDPVLLWRWPVAAPAAAAPIQPLA